MLATLTGLSKNSERGENLEKRENHGVGGNHLGFTGRHVRYLKFHYTRRSIDCLHDPRDVFVSTGPSKFDLPKPISDWIINYGVRVKSSPTGVNLPRTF